MRVLERILLVEDDPDLGAGIQENLQAEGYSVRLASRGDDGLRLALESDFHLVILDVMLPGLDGYEICSRLRGHGSNVPVLFLTARAEPSDRVRGLAEGGDDYMGKPFDLAELLARVSAILRRQRWYAGGEVRVVRFGGNEVDLRRYRGTDATGREHELTHKEAQILKCLFDREGEVVARDDILDRVWGAATYPSSRTIDNFILRLRRRFELDPAAPRHFHTVHGIGYRFTGDAET